MQKRTTKYKAVMQRQDGVMYVSQGYGLDSSFLSYLFDFENNRWDKFLETITTEEKFVKLFPDDDEDLKGWTHIENIQYTESNDKNNVEIYDGDILAGINGTINGIGWKFGNYIVKYKNGNHNVPEWGNSENFNGTHWFEVIGNIYENPELSIGIK